MEPDRTCKRCSVARVNLICKAYQKAHGEQGESALSALRKIDDLVKTRGFGGAAMLLLPGLGEKDLRAHCWNISSFLQDEETERILEGII
jgi:hypothetical protein